MPKKKASPPEATAEHTLQAFQALTAEQIDLILAAKVAEGSIARKDLVLWARARFDLSLEVAEDLVQEEVDRGEISVSEDKRCYSRALIERLTVEAVKNGHRRLDDVCGAVEEQSGCPPEVSESVLSFLAHRKVLELGDAEEVGDRPVSLWKETPPSDELRPFAEVLAEVGLELPELVEGKNGSNGSKSEEAKEAHDDARDLRQDSKKLVSMMDLLRRRTSLKSDIAITKEELKELTDELKGIDAQLDSMASNDAPPRKEETAAPTPEHEPVDQPLPFEKATAP